MGRGGRALPSEPRDRPEIDRGDLDLFMTLTDAAKDMASLLHDGAVERRAG
ncbi:MAG: hypothetical protein ACRDZR_14575 [Acidimicrobiales bacterium]